MSTKSVAVWKWFGLPGAIVGLAVLMSYVSSAFQIPKRLFVLEGNYDRLNSGQAELSKRVDALSFDLNGFREDFKREQSRNDRDLSKLIDATTAIQAQINVIQNDRGAVNRDIANMNERVKGLQVTMDQWLEMQLEKK